MARSAMRALSKSAAITSLESASIESTRMASRTKEPYADYPFLGYRRSPVRSSFGAGLVTLEGNGFAVLFNRPGLDRGVLLTAPPIRASAGVGPRAPLWGAEAASAIR